MNFSSLLSQISSKVFKFAVKLYSNGKRRFSTYNKRLKTMFNDGIRGIPFELYKLRDSDIFSSSMMY